MTQRRIPRCLPLGGLAIMIAAALLLALWGAVQAASPQPPRHDIIVLLDNSGTVVDRAHSRGACRLSSAPKES